MTTTTTMLFGSIEPGIHVRLPPPFIVSTQALAIFYTVLLIVDYQLLRNESRLRLTKGQLRIAMVVVHVVLPLAVVSRRHLDNMFLVGIPWAIVTYSAAALPMDGISVGQWIDGVLSILADLPQEERDQRLQMGKVGGLFDHNNKGSNRFRGCVKVIRGLAKLAFTHVVIQPWLPADNRFLLSLRWFDPLSLALVLLYGIKAYCMLGVVDIGMGFTQIILGIHLIDLFNSPILASSPRNFWSRRWNMAVHNLLHRVIFLNTSKNTNDDDKKTKSKEIRNDKYLAGLFVFLVSGIFHELFIMAMFRKMTLENLVFFMVQGVAVFLQLQLRKRVGLERIIPCRGPMRVLCVTGHILFLAATGRLFLAPFLRNLPDF